ncbi:MAG: pilus assembly protein TadG-related protein, partial [Actinomycetota bacterium]
MRSVMLSMGPPPDHGVSPLAGERGATLALVALSMVWIVGLAALVLDVSDGWLSRENLIVASDAAALAAAQDLVNAPWDEPGACVTARSYVLDNAPEAVMTNCDAEPLGTDGGWVTVTVTEDLDTTFAQVDGADPEVAGVSSAAWGPPSTVTTLRPFALCYDGSAQLQQLIDNPPFGPTWVRVNFTRDDPTDCGGTANGHNFATIDFESGSSVQDIRTWMRDGYPGQVGFDAASVADCSAGTVCYDRPYASDAIGPELGTLRSS